MTSIGSLEFRCGQVSLNAEKSYFWRDYGMFSIKISPDFIRWTDVSGNIETGIIIS